MPVIDFRLPDFLGLYGAEIDRDLLLARLPMLGGDLDKADGDQIAIEYFPDRPDLVSVEGIARAMRAFEGHAPGLVKYRLAATGDRLEVDATVGPVRPMIVMCRVEGLPPLDATTLKALMDFQERLGHGIGRRRRRVAIGIHDAAHVRGPFRYTTVPGTRRFHPLQGEREMTVRQILSEHPKGVLYAHLLPAKGPYPILVDADDQVLSLPPVINGTRTELKEGTTDLILDLTGPDLAVLQTAMAILVTAFAERGARIVPFEVDYPKDAAFGRSAGKTVVAPDLTPQKGTLRVAEAERVLGFGLDRDTVIACLGRLGHEAKPDPKDPDRVRVRSPAWRADLLHEWDLIEDVAKGYGYDRVTDAMPAVITFGRTHPAEARARRVRTALVGLGFLEATTLTITSEARLYDRFRLTRPEGAAGPVLVRNPVTEDLTALRTWLTPGLFGILNANRHRDLPQALFEVGQVVRAGPDHPNGWQVAAVRADAKTGFSQVKGHVQAFLMALGVTATLEDDDHPAFLPGRVARHVDGAGTVLGRFGEVHPEVLEAHDVKVPVVAFEYDLDALLPLNA